MRTTKRGARTLRTIGSLGASLNLSPQTNATNCPPGYHWEAPGPIMGLGLDLRSMGACVADAPAPVKKVIPLHLTTAAPPPAPAAPPPAPAPVKHLPLHLTPAAAPAAPLVTTTPAADRATAPVETTTPAAPACDCWPWWWMLVVAAAAAAGGYLLTGKGSRKRRRNAAEYVCDHVIRRCNPIALLGA